MEMKIGDGEMIRKWNEITRNIWKMGRETVMVSFIGEGWAVGVQKWRILGVSYNYPIFNKSYAPVFTSLGCQTVDAKFRVVSDRCQNYKKDKSGVS